MLVGLAAAPLADVLLGRLDRSYRPGPAALEIWAGSVAGPPCCCAPTTRSRFGQIYRALQRAIEAAPRY